MDLFGYYRRAQIKKGLPPPAPPSYSPVTCTRSKGLRVGCESDADVASSCLQVAQAVQDVHNADAVHCNIQVSSLLWDDDREHVVLGSFSQVTNTDTRSSSNSH